MAVVPSVVLGSSVNFISGRPKAEYYMGVYFKKMLDFYGSD